MMNKKELKEIIQIKELDIDKLEKEIQRLRILVDALQHKANFYQSQVNVKWPPIDPNPNIK